MPEIIELGVEEIDGKRVRHYIRRATQEDWDNMLNGGAFPACLSGDVHCYEILGEESCRSARTLFDGRG